MNGRYEKEMTLDRKTKARLKNAPSVVEEYYYSMIGSGKSYNTAYAYIGYILSFLNFTFDEEVSDKFYQDIKASHINKYITSLRTESANGKLVRTSDSIIAVHWSALNSFFQFLVPDYIDKNPVENTTRPKIRDNPQVTYLTQEEILNMMKNAELNAQKQFKNRDLCFLKLGFSTGLRISAIIQINIEDVDLDNNKIKVTEKGNMDYYIMFGDNLKSQLLLWIEDRKKYFPHCNTDALFVSRQNNRMSYDAAMEMIKKYAEGITDKKVTPHVMRHSCATNLYEKTNDIYLCAKQLHHKNVTTTQRYAEISNDRQKYATNLLDNMF